MNDRIHVATRKGLFTLRDDRGRWRIDKTAFLGEQVTAVFFDPRTGRGYAGIKDQQFGCKLFRCEDAKEDWQPCGVPTYPPKPEGEVDECPMRKIPIPWSLEMIWALEAGQREGELWLGSLPGGLFHSTDGGDSWELVRSLWDRPERRKWAGGGYDYAGIHSICVDPRDGAVRIGVSTGGVWTTRDNGQTWANQSHGMRAEYMPPELAYDLDAQDPHRMVQCAAQPDAMWVQHHNGIFRSTDASTSWQEIENVQPSGFGFAVAVHPHDGDTAWFVPAIKDEKRIPVDGKLVVTRTTDGGASFESFGEGLPQQHAYDIIYRHALDVDATGERLALGSTTGSLFASSDAGQRWTAVNTHLPPINVVRFG